MAWNPTKPKRVDEPDEPDDERDPNEPDPADPNAPPAPPSDPPNAQTLPEDTAPTAPAWQGRETATPYTAAEDKSSWDSNEFAAPAYTAARYNPVAESGYDATKWNSPTHQTPKYVVGRILSGYDLNDPAQLRAAIGDIQRAYPGTTWAGGDVINFPGVGEVDIIRDFGGESGIAWQPKSALGAGAGAGAMTAYGTAAPMGAGAGGAAGLSPWSSLSALMASSGRPIDGQLDAARRSALLELLGQKPPTAAELQATPENQAYQLQAQRAMERDRAELAENAAYEGYDNTGYFDTELSGLRQERAEGEAGFLGQLAISRMAAQREDLKFAIAQAQQSGQFDLAHQLDQQRMLLDAAIQREQLDLDRQRLSEGARQFNNRLGYDYTALQLDANRDAVEYAT